MDLRDYVADTLAGNDATDPQSAAEALHVADASAPLTEDKVNRLRSFLDGVLPKAAVTRISGSLAKYPSLEDWTKAVQADLARQPVPNEAARATAAVKRAAAAGDQQAAKLLQDAQVYRRMRDDERMRHAASVRITGGRRPLSFNGGYTYAVQRVRAADQAIVDYGKQIKD